MNTKLPNIRFQELIQEANDILPEPYENGYIPKDVVVLIIDRASIEFEGDPSALDYERIKIKDNPYILAVADTNGRNACRIPSNFPNRIQQKALLAFKMLIGYMGIYPFKRIWALTVPESWRSEEDVDPTIGKYRG